MRTLLMLAALCLTHPAHASLSDERAGAYAEFGAGLGSGGMPYGFGGGWQAGAGVWFGKYDEDLALGRHWSIGATLRQDSMTTASRGLRTAPLVEFRRGIDLLLVGTYVGLASGPLWDTEGDLGGSVRLVGGVKYRFHPLWSVGLRLEGGVDIFPDGVGAQAGLLVVMGWSPPFRKSQ